MMAGLYGLDHRDMTSIGNRLRNQARRNQQKAEADQLVGYQWTAKGEDYTVIHNGATVTAVKDRKSSRHNIMWQITVTGPRGAVKHSRTAGLSNYSIQDWPIKFMINRDYRLTCLLSLIHRGEIPV